MKAPLILIVAITILTLPAFSVLPDKSARDDNFQSRNRIYGYLGVTEFHFTEIGMGTTLINPGTRTEPMIGVGFSLINFGNGQAFLNLEADYTQSSFNFEMGQQRPASALTFMAQGELRLGRGRFSGTMGLGIGILSLDRVIVSDDYYDYEFSAETNPSLAMDFGLKYSLMPHLMLRLAARFHLHVYDTGYEYWDEYDEIWVDDTESELLASSLFLGLEYHF